MATVSEVLGEGQMDTSGDGESLQISTTSPEAPVQPFSSRALHVKQGNLKSSGNGSRSSDRSSRSSLPPLMDRRPSHEVTHRGPGTMHLREIGDPS